MYKFQTTSVDIQPQVNALKQDKWAKLIEKSNLGYLHMNSIQLFLSSMESFVQQNAKATLSTQEIEKTMKDSLSIFDEALD